MKIKQYITLTLILLPLLFTGCEAKTQQRTTQVEKKQDPYVDFKRWSEERVCDKLLWKCLPERNDTVRWKKPLENGLDSFELTPKVNKKYDAIIKHYNKIYKDFWKTHDYEAYWKTHSRDKGEGPVKKSVIDQRFLERVRAKRFLVKMEQRLDKEFPGFWRDTPQKVRFRWIQRAMNKAKVFGGDPKLNNEMVELCARIGLGFDKDPKWDYITKFIKEDIENNISPTINYIDWTVFNKTHARTGTRITDWLMRRVIGQLPAPKKPYPRLND